MMRTAVHDYLIGLQQSICKALETTTSDSFTQDVWARPEGGGGISQYIEQGSVLERAAVLFSHVEGHQLPASATAQRPHLAGRKWEAMGLSLVIHPKNPFAPTTHANVRFFLARKNSSIEEDVFWFGGGMDLTPYYVFEEDAVHFHRSCKQALDPFGDQYYPRFKTWCDEYFYLKHREETRGIGGIFFDDLSEPDFDTSFNIMQSVGNHFVPAYVPILEQRQHVPYSEAHRDFQAHRRGRYVEFNLIYDRGTLFGLQSGGRAESILLSMPPIARWSYQYQPAPDSQEAQLYGYLSPRDWLCTQQ